VHQFTIHPSSFIHHPSSIILHPSSFILHTSSFILHPSLHHPSLHHNFTTSQLHNFTTLQLYDFTTSQLHHFITSFFLISGFSSTKFSGVRLGIKRSERSNISTKKARYNNIIIGFCSESTEYKLKG